MTGRKNKSEVPLEGEALNEVCTGMMLAALAITDNKPNTLRQISKTNPWHLEAVKCITATEEQAHEPLRRILYEDMNRIVLDWDLDISGITPGGHFLDTQGYIAHNDEIIVLSFRCSTSAFDWMTNLDTTSSAWELEEDLAQGYSGCCSGFEGLCCTGGNYKPRVHTGFYNNFLAALPYIKRHIDPLLKEHEKPRTLYVVGHSLGAGIATLAGCYFMTEYNWNLMRQRLVVVTAGSPRAVCNGMKDLIDAKREEFGKKCRWYRVVKGKDAVPSVPPKLFGFCHLVHPVKINDSGAIVLRTREDEPEWDLLELTEFRDSPNYQALKGVHRADDIFPADEEYFDHQSRYERLVARIPRPLRDHMPDFYLKPMLKQLGLPYGSSRSETDILNSLSDNIVEGDEGGDDDEGIKRARQKKKSRTWIPGMFRSKKTAPEETYF